MLVPFRALRPVVVLVASTAGMLLLLLAAPLRRLGVRFDGAVTRGWARLMLATYGVRVTVEGEPFVEPGIVVCDHVSYWDIVCLLAVQPGFFVSKASVKSWPVLGWGARLLPTIFIDRSRGAAATEQLEREARALLDGGRHVVVFPEGTTSARPCRRFKRGAFHVARVAGRPIHPMALLYDRMERFAWVGDDSFAPHLLRMTFDGGARCALRRLPPIVSGDDEPAEAIAARARRAVQAAVDDLGRGFAREAAAPRADARETERTPC